MQGIDILKDIEIREIQISALQEEISALKKVAEIYGLGGQTTKENNVISLKRGFGESKFAKPVGDAAEEVLKLEPNGLHLDEILSRIAEMGITPKRGSLDSALRNDGKKQRFKLLGMRMWTLKENYIEK